MAQENLLSLREVIDILNVPRQTVNRWIKDGTLAHVRIAGALRVRPEDVRALYEKEKSSDVKGRILVIDDDPLVAQALKNVLDKSGYQTLVASIGLAALDAVSCQTFDLIITDIRMPGMDGLETLKAIRDLRRQFGQNTPPEIVITAYDDEEVRQEANRLGVCDFIIKPFELQDLLTVVERNLSKGKYKTTHASQF